MTGKYIRYTKSNTFEILRGILFGGEGYKIEANIYFIKKYDSKKNSINDHKKDHINKYLFELF